MLRASAILVLLLGLAHVAAARPAARLPADVDVDVELELLREPFLTVAIRERLRGGAQGTTTMALAQDWGGVEDAERDLRGVSARDESGAPLTIERRGTHAWEVHHAPGATIEVRSYLVPSVSHFDWDTRYRSFIDERRFQLIGAVGLLLPKGSSDDEHRRVRLRWRGFREAGWTVASSFGLAQDELRFEETTEHLQLGAFIAAPDLRVVQRTVRGGRTLALAIAGRWRFTDSALFELTQRIVEGERAFFSDDSQPFFLAALLPIDVTGALGGAGSGLTHSFLFYLPPEAKVGQSLSRLIGHEYFHTWNGHVMRPEGAAGYWFSEGFTNFYRRRLLYRLGLLSLDEYAADLNGELSDYYLSPVIGASNAQIARDFWRSRDLGDLPYRRGDVVALLVDTALQRASGGTRSVDELMRGLFAEARSGRDHFTTDHLLQRIGELAPAATAALVRRIVVDGERAPIPELPADCLSLVRERVGSYELGFDRQRLQAESVIAGVVPGSAAARAGLRDGQKVTNVGIYYGDPRKPAELTVVDGDGEHAIRYLPQTARTVELPRFVARPDAPASCRERL